MIDNRMRRRARGLTLVQILLMIFIGGLCIAVCVPAVTQLWHRKKADRVLSELKDLDAALLQYSVETSRPDGFISSYADLKPYLPPDSELLHTDGKDAFGNSLGPFMTGAKPLVPQKTRESLRGVVADSFWGPYR